MFYQEFTDKYKEIQNKLMLFLDREDDIEENYKNLIQSFANYKIIDNRHELKSFLYLISNITNNHYQTSCFIGKIERLIQYLKEDIKKNFSNLKIFDIFKNSKSALLILIEQKIMTIDQSILNRISSKKYFNRSYHHFFFPEIHPIINVQSIGIYSSDENAEEENSSGNSSDENSSENMSDDNSSENSSDENSSENMSDDNSSENMSDDNSSENISDDNSSENISDDNSSKNISDDNDDNYDDKEIDFYQTKEYINFVKNFSTKLPDNFFKQRKIGQNEHYICKLIREDLIDEFISYVNQHNYPLNSKIEPSIYETNSLLIKNNSTLIEYAAFFGSIQIFKYLFLNKVQLTPSLWIYGIHGDDPELISILEENHVQPEDKTYFKCIKEAIKCHHIDVSNYIQNNYLNEKVESDHLNKNFKDNILSYSFHYYNFFYFPKELSNRFVFFYACKYDYYSIVEDLLKTKIIYLNKKIIFIFLIIK